MMPGGSNAVAEHGTLVTVLLVLMFVVTMVYAAWVMVLDWREQRDHEADTMSREAYEFQQAIQRRMEYDRRTLRDIAREDDQ